MVYPGNSKCEEHQVLFLSLTFRMILYQIVTCVNVIVTSPCK